MCGRNRRVLRNIRFNRKSFRKIYCTKFRLFIRKSATFHCLFREQKLLSHIAPRQFFSAGIVCLLSVDKNFIIYRFYCVDKAIMSAHNKEVL